jgi:cytochrome bd-type quinol oxidase subunit 2
MRKEVQGVGLTMTKRARRVDTTLLLAFAQFVIIVLLLSGVSAEYQSNGYMQEWIAQNAWPVGYLLNGYLASTLVGIAIGGGFLLLQRWRSTGDLGKE